LISCLLTCQLFLLYWKHSAYCFCRELELQDNLMNFLWLFLADLNFTLRDIK
jgi:hypothetical protein